MGSKWLLNDVLLQFSFWLEHWTVYGPDFLEGNYQGDYSYSYGDEPEELSVSDICNMVKVMATKTFRFAISSAWEGNQIQLVNYQTILV